MTLGSWRYYDREVARGLENYYLAAGEEAGRWMGAGAEGLGLDGEVTGEALELLFDQGRHPVSGEVLGRGFVHFPNRSTVTGFALSFSPPKSVSLLWGLADETVSAEVRAAHDAAVEAAVAFLERHAALSRAGKAGVFQVDTTGFVAAAFVHRTSRARDPQLHTHVLVANKLRGVDGAWRALDGRELYGMQKPAGMVYNAAIRAELTARLGVRFEAVDRNGQADIVGVPAGLVDRFSSRRRQVLERGARRIAEREASLGRVLSGGERAAEYQRAALDHRPAKAHASEDEGELRQRWAAEADAAGHPAPSWLADTLDLVVARRRVGIDRSVLVAGVVAEMTEAHSAFGRPEIAKQLAPLTPAGVGDAEAARAWMDETIDAVLAHGDVVALACPLLSDTPDGLRRSDGHSMVERHGQRHWTTRVTLAREALVLGVAEDGQDAHLGVVTGDLLARAVTTAGLSGDQAATVARLCRGGEQIACLVGPAGAGKTHTLRAAARAWEAAGYRVTGAAVSAKAAAVLAQEAGIPADTLARLLAREARGEIRFDDRDVLVIDEAGMVTTKDLAHLAGMVADDTSKLILVGDDHQLPPVGAGGLFRLLVQQTVPAELATVRRFSQPWEQEASLRLRAGDPSVVDDYDAHHRIHGGTVVEMVQQALAEWKRASDDGESVIVLGVDHHTVNTLSGWARAQRVEAGEVELGGVIAGGQVIGVGDHIVTCRNQRQLVTTSGHWVRNGDRWTVTGRSDNDSLTVASLEGHGHIVLDPSYVHEHVRLAYALTVHKAQGVTVDRSLLIADQRLTAELAYVSLTRGRHHNAAYLIVDTDIDHGPAVRQDARVVARGMLAHALTRPGVEASATETLRAQQNRADDLAVLYPLLEQARSHIDGHAGPDRTDELERLRRQAERLPALQAEADKTRARLAQVRQELPGVYDRLQRAARILRSREDARWPRRPSRAVAETARVDHAAMWRRRQELKNTEWVVGDRLKRLARDIDTAIAAARQLPALESDQGRRQQWLRDHQPDLDWHTELRERIADRTKHLGHQALDQQPEHLLELLGHPDAILPSRQWAAIAGRIEAYRERWRLEPHQLAAQHITSPAQRQHWNAVQRVLPDSVALRIDPPAPEIRGPSLSL